MKVGHLTTVDLSLRYLVLPQLLAVIERGGEVVGISAPGPWVGELEDQGVRHIPLRSSTRGMNVVADLRAAIELWHILSSERPDVLHTHNPKPGLYGRIVGRLTGVPVVINTVHGLYATSDDRIVKRLIVYSLEAIASRFSDEELVQNPEDLELLNRWRITPPARTSFLGNGVDLDRFHPDRFDADHRFSVRADLGIGDDQVAVGIVSRLVAEKGFVELFEAMEHLDDRFVLVCIGPHDPDKADALPMELVDRATASGVKFLGMRTDVDALYPALDLFVLPSHREGFPRAAMEAAASGLPVIATDIRGCRQVVEDGVNGELIPVRDPGALAGSIRRIGSDEARRREMGAAGRRRAEDHFDESRVVERVLSAYRRVARRKGLSDLADGLRDDSQADVLIRPADLTDADFIADLHSGAIATGFLPTLGRPFMVRLYRALITWRPSVVLVADRCGEPTGFVAGVPNTTDFYRYFAVRHGIAAAFVALPSLVRPSTIRRVWETFRYGGDDSGVPAELLSMAVSEDSRRQGVGGRLGEEFLTTLGEPAVRVVVGSSNTAAIPGYERLGFVPSGPVEVHAGEASLELVWRASP